MQALSSWTPPTGVLATLVDEALARAAALREHATTLAAAARSAPARESFAAALRRPHVAVIAEIKRRSPSRGDINPTLPLAERAIAYAGAGAAALSVLTQASHFGGSAADLAEAARVVSIPLLRKDFLVHPVQMVEARVLGASAVLLIVRALPPDELAVLARAARDAGLETLIEVRDERELAAAVAAGADVIGVNNRNLETLAIDAAVSEWLLPMVPAAYPAVFESGVGGRSDVERAARCGADAVLVGSALSAAADPAAAVAALAGVPRAGRDAAR